MSTGHSPVPHKKKKKHSKKHDDSAPPEPSTTQQQPGRYELEEGFEPLDTACIASFHGVAAGTSELWLLQLPDPLTAHSLNGVKLKLSTKSAADRDAGLVGRFTDDTGNKYALSEEQGSLANQLQALVPSGAGEVHSYPFAKRLTVVHDLLSPEPGEAKSKPRKHGKKDGKKDKVTKSGVGKPEQKEHRSKSTAAAEKRRVPDALEPALLSDNLRISHKKHKKLPQEATVAARGNQGGAAKQEAKPPVEDAQPAGGSAKKKEKQLPNAAAAREAQSGGSTKKEQKQPHATQQPEGSAKKKEKKRASPEAPAVGGLHADGSAKKKKKQKKPHADS